MKVIEIQDISKRFGEHVVLNHITASFQKGTIYGIVGRNGSGKTVLLECICGLMHQDEGTILVNGKTIGKEVDIADNIGVIIETPGFLPNYSGFRNLHFLMGVSKKINPEKIRAAMELVGLNPNDKKRVGKYSLGMRQRLGIAQAIMENPDILILDEPMNGLDKEGVTEMRQLFLQKKSEGKLILMASHNREDIELLCDEVYEMENGILSKIWGETSG